MKGLFGESLAGEHKLSRLYQQDKTWPSLILKGHGEEIAIGMLEPMAEGFPRECIVLRDGTAARHIAPKQGGIPRPLPLSSHL